jgi:8-oxo-dGTP pyrophosphatase MutT (NUDIX family)
MNEETGIDPGVVEVNSTFRFEETYFPIYKRFGGQRVEKTVCIYVGRVKEGAEFKLKLTEHQGCEWHIWDSPPRSIQTKTIDPLLAKVDQHFNTNPIDDSASWK